MRIPHSKQDSLPLRIFPFPCLVTKGDFEGGKGIHQQCFEALTNTLCHCFYESKTHIPDLESSATEDFTWQPSAFL